jgi:hypothetical protein
VNSFPDIGLKLNKMLNDDKPTPAKYNKLDVSICGNFTSISSFDYVHYFYQLMESLPDFPNTVCHQTEHISKQKSRFSRTHE